MEKTRNFGSESDRRRNLLICCLRYIISAPVERVFSTSGLSMQPHSARHMGNKLLSELVMIKSNIKLQPVDACFIDSDDSDSLLTVMM